ncbi:membrane protein [Spirosoma knui]
MNQTYVKAFGIGVIAGMRAVIAPALLSRKLVRTIPTKQPATPVQYLAQPTTSMVLNVLAAGELIGDKLPGTPNRTLPTQFSGRVASGATCGAFVSQVEGAGAPVGAVLGGLGAAVGTLAFFHLRQWLTHEAGLPDLAVALVEDALAIGAGWSIVNQIEAAPQTA